MPNNPNMRISLHIILSPFLKLTFLNEDLGLVHYLDVELMVLLDALEFVYLGVLN